MDQDWVWIQKFQKGDNAGFNQIFNQYKNKVINLSFRFVKNKQAAEDIAQEVFIKIYEKKVKIDPDSKFFTWLYRVTVNASLDLIRRNKWAGRSLDEEEEGHDGQVQSGLERLRDPKSSSVIQVLEKEELWRMVRQEIDQMPETLKNPILLYQFEEMSYLEIAQILQISPKAVERRLYHAKELLRKKLSGIL